LKDLLFYRIPNTEIQQFSGQFKKVDSFIGAKGFILSTFDKTKKFIFEKQEVEGVVHFTSSEGKIQSREEYLNSGGQFLEKIRTRKLSKAIFSRIKEVSTANEPETIFRKLCENYPTAFVYLISSSLFGTWIGASPEVLLDIKNGVGKTIALAGTKSSYDKTNWGEKEKDEQKIVSDFIADKLLQLKVKKIQKSKVGELIAGPVKHLATNFFFEQGEVTVADIIESIHPTPAVCGLPQKEALELIREEEQHSRSLYAGVIGLVSEEESKLFVNLRCAQLFGHNAFLYLGGGYTNDSIVENEWIETENKAKTLLKVL
tara:strand:- start:941 stop:1888 length:948 start_codon:yes stop_codon:yes gene_type:complete